jgi:hypothetical protein
MTIVNGYLTQVAFKADKRITSLDAVDDAQIDGIITAASRLVERACNGRRFFARSETRTFNKPWGRELMLDDDLLSVTHLYNGDGTEILAADYLLLPLNALAKDYIRIKQSAAIEWLPDADGNTEGVISLNGVWGYCDRTASDVRSVERVVNTSYAALETAVMMYQQRFGGKEGMKTVITPAAVIQVPNGESMPKMAWDRIKGYKRQT